MKMKKKSNHRHDLHRCRHRSLCDIGSAFLAVREKDVIVSGPGVTEIKMLSDYFPKLKDTPGDTEVYVMKGKRKVRRR